jgi:polyhydroxybutyrate depolymerase
MRQLAVAFLVCLFVIAAAQAPPSFAANDRETLRDRFRERRGAQPVETGRGKDIRSPGDHVRTLVHDGFKRQYLVHVPKGYNPTKPTPLVVAMHGGGGNLEIQANDTYYGLIGKSEGSGTIVVFPNGYSRRKTGKLATWNAGECCGAAQEEGIDDVGFIRAMLAELQAQLNIDSKRIYATGMSNGGMMSYRLACEMSDVFRAIAPVAGTDNTRTCHPTSAVSVLHIHALNDTHVSFNGGAGPDAIKSAVNEFTSVPSTVSKWVKLNSCHSTPKRVLQKPGVYCDLYASCKNGAEVQLCVTEDGGHSWPGGVKPRGNGTPSQAISATDTIWDFFERVSH